MTFKATRSLLKAFLLVAVSGCASGVKGTGGEKIDFTDSESQVVLTSPRAGIEAIRYQVLKVEGGASDGEAMVVNRRSFLGDLFQQSQDPYFGTYRWSEDCLKKNVLGNVVRADGEVRFRAELMVDSLWNPGDCSPGGRPALLHVAYCPKMARVVVAYVIGERAAKAQLVCGESVHLAL